MAVDIDIIRGSRGRKGRNRAGDVVWLAMTRIAVVSGVTGDADERLDNAIVALVASDATLDIDGTHPHIAGLVVKGHRPETVKPDVVRVGIEYEYEEAEAAAAASVTVGSTVEQAQANTAYELNDDEEMEAGKIMKVTYPVGSENHEPVMTSVLRPRTTLHFRWFEQNATAADVVTRSKLYAGYCNSGRWFDVDPKANAREYLCTQYVGSSEDGRNFTVDAEFAFKSQDEGGWDAYVYYIDETTGKPPKDAVDIVYGEDSGVGWARFQMYDTVDFSEMRLTT